jgi:hypothetical protein
MTFMSREQAGSIVADGATLWCTCDHPDAKDGMHVLGCVYMDAFLLLRPRQEGLKR